MSQNNTTTTIDTLISDTLIQIEELQNKIKKNEDFEPNKSKILHLWKKASTEKYSDSEILFIKEEYFRSKECTDYLVVQYLLLQGKYDIVDTLISEICKIGIGEGKEDYRDGIDSNTSDNNTGDTNTGDTNSIDNKDKDNNNNKDIINNNKDITNNNKDIINNNINNKDIINNNINNKDIINNNINIKDITNITNITTNINDNTYLIIRSLRDNHLDLMEMVNELKNGKFEKIEKFIEENRNLLRGKDLLFYYNCLQFITFTRNKWYKRGIIFARENLKEYFMSRQFKKRVKRLMCILSGTDYEVYWKYYLEKIVEQVCVDFCYLKNYPGTNILDILFRNGKNVFPELVQASANYFKQSVVTVDEEEIPVQVSVTEDGKFHSQFVCPVLKVLCENDNLPSLLECGHVISSKAVSKLSKNNTFVCFKCPYCPQESRTENIVTIRL
ncbi:hypothetical protein CWI39_1939p0020 [Hamiltosporidium magnivora]|uniref:RING-Gid-type domain-containing protein n=1 Tax=Hamiltosporidium magnivora TaxID=148818 RepID=A0A4Q9KXI5_9MICR|nr:hypothetical protein CWI39_1939p0020 [Hamiltosporidium magnivora]